MRRETFHSKIELAKEQPAGGVAGYAYTWQDKPVRDMVIKRGAFAKTLSEGVPLGKVKLTADHDDGTGGLIGTLTAAVEDDYGVLITAKYSAVQKAQDIRVQVDEGILDSFSISFSPIVWGIEEQDGDSVRVISELKLWAVGIVPFPEVDSARIMSNFAASVDVVGYPMADRGYAFDAKGALERVRKWAGVEGFANHRFDSAFLSRDDAMGFNVDAYGGLIVDIIDGKPSLIPSAIIAAAGEFADDKALRSVFDRYFSQMRRAFGDHRLLPPWKASANTEAAGPVEPPTDYLDKARDSLVQLQSKMGGSN
jgi:HK97 family phage prohead protease